MKEREDGRFGGGSVYSMDRADARSRAWGVGKETRLEGMDVDHDDLPSPVRDK